MQTLESERAALEDQLAAAQVDLSCCNVSPSIITISHIEFWLPCELSMQKVHGSCAALHNGFSAG